MARIYIKGRREPLEIENTRAQMVKNRKLGLNNKTMADPMDMVDLGDWCGEYGRIGEIELTQTQGSRIDTYQDIADKKERQRVKKWKAMSPQGKAEQLGAIRLSYSVRIGDYKAEIPEELVKEIVAIRKKFYEEQPDVEKVPAELYEHLLPPRRGNGSMTKDLAEKMSMPKNEPNGEKCKQCEKPLVDNQKDFCSGNCRVEKANGNLSTE